MREPPPRRRRDPLDLVLGAVFLIGSSIWTIHLVRDGFTPWALLTGLGALLGLTGLTQWVRPPDEPTLNDHPHPHG